MAMSHGSWPCFPMEQPVQPPAAQIPAQHTEGGRRSRAVFFGSPKCAEKYLHHEDALQREAVRGGHFHSSPPQRKAKRSTGFSGELWTGHQVLPPQVTGLCWERGHASNWLAAQGPPTACLSFLPISFSFCTAGLPPRLGSLCLGFSIPAVWYRMHQN